MTARQAGEMAAALCPTAAQGTEWPGVAFREPGLPGDMCSNHRVGVVHWAGVITLLFQRLGDGDEIWRVQGPAGGGADLRVGPSAASLAAKVPILSVAAAGLLA